MLFTIEFFRLREEDDAHATLDRITLIGTDLEAVKVKAKSLFETLNMPQKPDGLRILDRDGDEVFSWTQVPTMHQEGPDSVEVRSRAGDARQFSPSAARNCGPIREVLTRVLPKKGIALEIGSGTGEHVICFAKALPGSSGCRAIPTRPRAPASRRGVPPKGSPMCGRRSPSTCAAGCGAWRTTHHLTR